MNTYPRFAGIRRKIHSTLEDNGWLVRRMRGLPAGVDLIWDIEQRLRIPLRTIIDIGAHKGETVQYFHERLISCQILAFEPVSKTFQDLRASWGSAKNVHLRHMALADIKGRLTICLKADSQSNSLNSLARSSPFADEIYEEVLVSTLDVEALATFRDQPIDLVKIDVEGVELRVLQGAKKLLVNKSIRLILSEFTLNLGDTQHTQLDDLRSFLWPYGFSLVGFYDQVIWDAPARLGYANALFALAP